MRLIKSLALGTALATMALFPVTTVAAAERPGGAATAGAVAAPDFELPAVQLRIGLSRVLGEHAFLTIEAMRTGITEGPEFEVAAEALERNTVDLLELVEAAYGRDAAVGFGEQWRNHLAYLVDYTRAVAAGDDDARELASSQLRTYIEDFTDLLAAANPGLPPDVVRGLIDEHIQQLEQIGNFADAGFAQAYPAIRDTYEHMFSVGDGLTVGIVSRFASRFPGRDTAFSPAVDMRIALDRLLGEHTYLASIAMRARLTDAADLDAAISALDGNSADLADQIARIYGTEAGAAFGELWTSHTDHYLEYVAAVADGQTAAREGALDGLRTYRSDFSAFLADANPFLDEDALEGLLAAHTDHLVGQVTSYDGGDFEDAYDTLREAFRHTEQLAAGLGGAIADQFPRLFPDTATNQPSPDGWPLPVGWILMSSAVVGSLVRRRRDRRAQVSL